jgi:hypothetical protein
MRRLSLLVPIIGALALCLVNGTPAQAQATRTWVSGVGDDANPCSRTAPCKTFAGAISKTANGGEIDALDPGGFGALTITKSITLDGGGGQVASILVAGTNGINVSAQPTDVVIIRNLRFDGLLGNGSNSANAGINGINFGSGGTVIIDNCDIFGFNNNGINVALGATGFMQVRNTTLRNNKVNGLAATTSSGAAVVQVYNSSIVGAGPSGAVSQGGISAGSNGFITVSESNFQVLTYGAQTQTGGTLNVDRSMISSTTNGLLAASGTTINASNNVFMQAGTAFGGTGSYVSDNLNRIGGSTAQGATPSAMLVK